MDFYRFSIGFRGFRGGGGGVLGVEGPGPPLGPPDLETNKKLPYVSSAPRFMPPRYVGREAMSTPAWLLSPSSRPLEAGWNHGFMGGPWDSYPSLSFGEYNSRRGSFFTPLVYFLAGHYLDPWDVGEGGSGSSPVFWVILRDVLGFKKVAKVV